MGIVAIWLKTIWAAAGKRAAAIGAAMLAVVSLIMGHRYKVRQAGKTGRKEGETTERNRINTETQKEVEERKETSDEKHEESRNLDDDALTKRMLEQQARRKRRR